MGDLLFKGIIYKQFHNFCKGRPNLILLAMELVHFLLEKREQAFADAVFQEKTCIHQYLCKSLKLETYGTFWVHQVVLAGRVAQRSLHGHRGQTQGYILEGACNKSYKVLSEIAPFSSQTCPYSRRALFPTFKSSSSSSEEKDTGRLPLAFDSVSSLLLIWEVPCNLHVKDLSQ